LRRIVTLGAAIAFSLVLVPSAPSRAALARPVMRYMVADTEGFWSPPASGVTATKLVVIGHGCCYAGASGVFTRDQSINAVSRVATDHTDAVVIAPDYTGDGNWNARAGTDDVTTMIGWARANYPTITLTIEWGISMGGEATGISTTRDRTGADYWVGTYPVSDLAGYWGQTTAANRGLIEADMGGAAPSADPGGYAAMSVLGQESRLGGTKRVYLFHGTADNKVSPAQSTAVATNLKTLAIPVTLISAVGAGHDAAGVWRTYSLVVDPLLDGAVPLAPFAATKCTDLTSAEANSPPPGCARL